MTSLKNQSTMRRISPNNPVRRRLFPEDAADEGRADNFANALQETVTRDKTENMKKWNFDFENEVPLEGNIEWTPCNTNGYIWVGKEKDEKELETMQVDNESTPKTAANNSVPVVRKRRTDGESCDKEVRRKISFD